MIIAIVMAVLFRLAFSKVVGEFVGRHSTLKIMALCFLLLIGLALIGEGFGVHIPRGPLYFAMAFSVFVEMLNLKWRSQKMETIQHRKSYVQENQNGADY